MQYSGPHAGANTSLLYPIPNVSEDAGPWRIWIRCTMPDGGSDSYFFYVSKDGGDKWEPQQTAAWQRGMAGLEMGRLGVGYSIGER